MGRQHPLNFPVTDPTPGPRDVPSTSIGRRLPLSFLTWYWGMVATYADELTWLGVGLVVAGFYLRSKVP